MRKTINKEKLEPLVKILIAELHKLWSVDKIRLKMQNEICGLIELRIIIKGIGKMKITKYHAKYFAYELTRQLPSNDIGKLTASLQDAQVD